MKKSKKELKIVELVEGDASSIAMIAMTLPSAIVDDLISFLKESLDVFSRTHEDMPSIDGSVIEHRLNVDLKKKPV